jgi:hypothetical protein
MVFPLAEDRPFNAGDTSPSGEVTEYHLFVPNEDFMIENILAALTMLTNFHNWNADSGPVIADILDGMCTMLETFEPL